MSFVVAIDGPAGAGKGTITKLAGNQLGLIIIDTGAIFRCVALNMIQENVSINDEEKIKKVLENIDVQMTPDGEKILNGEVVTHKIRENDVNSLVSPVAAIPIIREKVLEIERKMSEGKEVIMEGRDIGTYVFPNAEVKIYLDATPEERAKRRVLQNLESGIQTSYEEVLKNIKDRDYRDSHRKIAPLTRAEDAIYIDSSDMTIEQVVEKVIKIVNEKRGI